MRRGIRSNAWGSSKLAAGSQQEVRFLQVLLGGCTSSVTPILSHIPAQPQGVAKAGNSVNAVHPSQ
jgi:hypothetical protein